MYFTNMDSEHQKPLKDLRGAKVAVLDHFVDVNKMVPLRTFPISFMGL